MNKEYLKEAIEVFGDFREKFIICSDMPILNPGDEVTLVNSNCGFEFDNITCTFNKDLYYYYIVDLELLETDYSNYEVNKSTNGGAYAYATCKVMKVHEKTY